MSRRVQSSQTIILNLVLAAAFAALYAILVVAFLPISFNLYQVRIADILLPTAVIFGWPAVVGLGFGAGVANVFGGLGPVDVVGGGFANFMATFIAWKIGARPLRTSGFLSWLLLTIGAGAVVPIIASPFIGLEY